MTPAMSSAAKTAKRGVVSLQGLRPQPLNLPAAARPAKRPRGEDGAGGGAPPPGPIIVYEHTPKVIHVRADEFKALVQRLTGQQEPIPPAPVTTTGPPPEEEATTAADALVLTLGQQAAPPPLDDQTLALPPSPGGALAAAGFLLSPGSFLFSPGTMQALQELIS